MPESDQPPCGRGVSKRRAIQVGPGSPQVQPHAAMAGVAARSRLDGSEGLVDAERGGGDRGEDVALGRTGTVWHADGFNIGGPSGPGGPRHDVVGFGGFAAGFGADRVEVHEPGLEQGLGDGFQCFAETAIEFDFVIERAEDIRYVLLLCAIGRKSNCNWIDKVSIQRWLGAAGVVAAKANVFKKVVRESRIIPMKVCDI